MTVVHFIKDSFYRVHICVLIVDGKKEKKTCLGIIKLGRFFILSVSLSFGQSVSALPFEI